MQNILQILRRMGSPKEGEIPPSYRNLNAFDEKQLRFFWRELARLHNDENSLLNSRVQFFLITTSLLLAAFSQFRDNTYFELRVLFCLGALAFTIGSWIVLLRTARAVQWYSAVLTMLDGF